MGTGILSVNIIAIGWAAAVMSCMLGTLASCICRRRRFRRRKEVEFEDDGSLSGDRAESAAITNATPSMTQDQSTLQPQRRGLFPQRSGATREPAQQTTGLEDGLWVYHEVEEDVGGAAQRMGRRPTDPRATCAPTESSPPRLSIMISDARPPGRVIPRPPPTPPFTHRQTSSVGGREPRSSATNPGSIYPFAAGMGIQSTHRRTLSAAGASRPSTVYTDSVYPVSTLPSYPGTVRSVSPPAYSDLSRTRSGRTTRASERGLSNYAESVFESVPNFTRLEK